MEWKEAGVAVLCNRFPGVCVWVSCGGGRRFCWVGWVSSRIVGFPPCPFPSALDTRVLSIFFFNRRERHRLILAYYSIEGCRRAASIRVARLAVRIAATAEVDQRTIARSGAVVGYLVVRVAESLRSLPAGAKAARLGRMIIYRASGSDSLSCRWDPCQGVDGREWGVSGREPCRRQDPTSLDRSGMRCQSWRGTVLGLSYTTAHQRRIATCLTQDRRRTLLTGPLH